VLVSGFTGGIDGAGVASAAVDLDTQTNQLWERHWRVYAQRCAEFEGEYICAPKYDRRYPSSSGITVRQAEAELSKKVRVGGSGVVRTKIIKMPVQEAESMALPIPKIKIGEYGVLVSAEIVEVLGPKSMVVEDLYLIDPAVYRRDYRADRAKAKQAEDDDAAEAELAHIYTHRDALVERQKDKRHKRIVLRLEGYATDGLSEGDRWTGPREQGFSVLIASAEYYSKQRRPKKRAVAVAVDQVKWGLQEDAFIRLLEARGLTPKDFIDLVMEKMAEDDPKTAQLRIFTALLPVLEDPIREEEKDDQENGDREEKGETQPDQDED